MGVGIACGKREARGQWTMSPKLH